MPAKPTLRSTRIKPSSSWLTQRIKKPQLIVPAIELETTAFRDPVPGRRRLASVVNDHQRCAGLCNSRMALRIGWAYRELFSSMPVGSIIEFNESMITNGNWC